MGTLSSRPKGDPGTLPIFRICYFCQITPVVFIFVTDGQQTKCNKFEEEKACLHHQLTSLQQDHQLISQKMAEAQTLMAHLQDKFNKCKEGENLFVLSILQS